MNRFIITIALFATATACATERVVAPKSAAPSFVSTLASAPQVPLLFVVDGVKYQRDQVPELSADEVAEVRVMKGRAALRAYGPDASYGVVVVTTRHAAAPRS